MHSRVRNGPTEDLNNVFKHSHQIKRTAFGFRNFHNYRIRALLYTGKPNWNLLTTIGGVSQVDSGSGNAGGGDCLQ